MTDAHCDPSGTGGMTPWAPMHQFHLLSGWPLGRCSAAGSDQSLLKVEKSLKGATGRGRMEFRNGTCRVHLAFYTPSTRSCQEWMHLRFFPGEVQGVEVAQREQQALCRWHLPLAGKAIGS